MSLSSDGRPLAENKAWAESTAATILFVSAYGVGEGRRATDRAALTDVAAADDLISLLVTNDSLQEAEDDDEEERWLVALAAF
jgi:hypothetical protein